MDEKEMATQNTVQNAQLMEALCQDIYDIYCVERKTEQVRVLRQHGLARELNDSSSAFRTMDYRTIMNLYIENNVHPSDRKEMRRYIDFDMICRELEKTPCLDFFYRVLRDRSEQNFYLKCCRIGGEGFEYVAFAFSPVSVDVNQQQLIRAIETDEVTGVYTKQAMYHHIRNLLDTEPDTKFDVMMADVENFRLINSIYGDAEGDALLRYLADNYAQMPQCRICARYGADQFVMVLEAKEHVDEQVFADFVQELAQNAPIPYLSLKFGVVRYVERGDSVSALCDKAMLALKNVKHSYGKIVGFYDGQLIRQHYREQMMESGFARAMARREFILNYQPKYNAVTGRLDGAEALVRWQSGEELLSAVEFIPVFERNGYIVQLDEYVFRQVCAVQKKLLAAGLEPVPISVNLSRTSLFNPGCSQLYQQIAADAGVALELVPLELTESAAADSEQTRTLVEQLKEAGFHLHMDDFGSGFSSLSLLSALPFDTVKLDKSLIDDIGNSKGDEILRHIIELAHFLKMQVVAEGVERKDQYNFLKKLSCDTIQGYYFRRPLPYAELELLLRQRAEELRQARKEETAEEASVGSLRLTSDVKLLYLSAIGSIYMTMHAIDLVENTTAEFATTTNVKEHVNRVNNADAQMAAVMSNVVSPEHIPACLEFTDLHTLPERMRGKRTISADFIGTHFGWFRARFIAVTTNAQDEPEKVIFTTQVIEADKRKEEQLIRACRTDELTGILNRRAFLEDLKPLEEGALALPENRELCLLSADIDGLKFANDTYGHAAGDELIWGAAESLNDTFGKCGHVYRLGGDEFAVLFRADEKETERLLDDFRDRVDNWIGNEIRTLRVSFGAAAHREAAELDIHGLRELADRRMLERKAERHRKNG